MSVDIHNLIGKIPILPKKGLMLLNHKYTGPYNPLEKQLDRNDKPLPGNEPYNAVDRISMHHDICYRDAHGNKDKKHECDDTMLKSLKNLKPSGLRESFDRKLVQGIIGAKRKLGWGTDIKWSDELANELHKPIKRKFIKRRVFAKGVDDIWTADLVFMIKYAEFNDGEQYILTVIDVFSKYGWMIPLKNKTGKLMASTFETLIKKSKRKPSRLWCDKGLEFWNKDLDKVLKKYSIKLYKTENEEKSSVIERWNRTMKRNMWKYFTANNTWRYIDILPKLVQRYNKTYHRSIKTTPEKASNMENSKKVREALYGNIEEFKAKPKFNVNDKVRISKFKRKFEKGYTPNWTEELFTIVKVKPTKPPTYKISDTNGEIVKGSFYEPELQKSKQNIYRVEKVLKHRTRQPGNHKEVFVKWKGYSKSFNSWIPIGYVVKDYQNASTR